MPFLSLSSQLIDTSVPMERNRGRPRVKNLRTLKARPRIQRTFLQWFAESRSRFVTPPRIKRRTDKYIELTFPQITTALQPVFDDFEIAVWVEWEGKYWDVIADFECSVKRLGDGAYICGLCLPEYIVKYPTRESLWIAHLFEPFLEWCNNTLAPARWLALHGTHEGGATWAKLLLDDTDSEGAYARIELQMEGAVGLDDTDSEGAYARVSVHLKN